MDDLDAEMDAALLGGLFNGLIAEGGPLWTGQSDDPWVGYPPWAICKQAPAGRVVREARHLLGTAIRLADEGQDYTPRALYGWAQCCWLWSWIAFMEGR